MSFRRCGREKTLINPYYPHRCEFYIQWHISKYKSKIKTEATYSISIYIMQKILG